MKIAITRPIPDPGLKRLQEAGLEVFVRERDIPPSAEELAALGSEYPVLLTQLTDPVDEGVLSAGVRLVAQLAVGHDNIDLSAAARHGVLVTHTPGVLTQATAELTWALILAGARHIVPGDAYVREGRFKAWGATLFLGTELRGKTLGVLGAGRIGSRVGEIGLCFGMRLLYHDKSPCPRLDAMGAQGVSLEDLLKESDVVSVHLPLTHETRGLLGEGQLRLMKRTALLINTARGPIVDEEALAKALEKGWIAGAGLDVYEHEPRVNPRLLNMENVVLLPHIGSATREARGAMALAAAESIIAFARGQRPPHLLNPEVLG